MKTRPDYALPLRDASGVLLELVLIARLDPVAFLVGAEHVVASIMAPFTKMLILAQIEQDALGEAA